MADTVNAFNSQGRFNRFYDWTDDRDAGETVLKASRFDQENDRFAAGINAIIEQTIQGFKGEVKAPVGTAGSPGYAFEADPDTGMYRSAANRISLAAGGTEIFRASGSTRLEYNGTAAGLKYGIHKIWHEGNDGDGSGLAADSVDGLHANQLQLAMTDAQIGDKAFSNPPDGLTTGERDTVRERINLSDANVGDKAFKNPPSSLTLAQRNSVRSAIQPGGWFLMGTKEWADTQNVQTIALTNPDDVDYFMIGGEIRDHANTPKVINSGIIFATSIPTWTNTQGNAARLNTVSSPDVIATLRFAINSAHTVMYLWSTDDAEDTGRVAVFGHKGDTA